MMTHRWKQIKQKFLVLYLKNLYTSFKSFSLKLNTININDCIVHNILNYYTAFEYVILYYIMYNICHGRASKSVAFKKKAVKYFFYIISF